MLSFILNPTAGWLHWKRLWCWEGLGAGGEGDNRGWDSWMASPTQWTWVCVNSGSWWWTGRPGVLQFMGSQRVSRTWLSDWTELNWKQVSAKLSCSVAKSCLTCCDPMDCSMPCFPDLHHLPEFAQIHVHWVGDAIQPSHPLSLPSLLAFNLTQHQSLFQWVGSSHQVAKVLKVQLQHQSFQWIFRVDFL